MALKNKCDCQYCKNNLHEYFCIACGHSFNECESLHKYDDITLCPLCHPVKPLEMPTTFPCLKIWVDQLVGEWEVANLCHNRVLPP